MPLARSADPEPDFAEGLFEDRLDRVDPCPRRTLAAPPEHLVDGDFRPFEECLDATVGPIAHPPRDASRPRLAAAGLAEPHALHPTRDEHAAADRHTWHAEQ